jgi:hypothetical protein
MRGAALVVWLMDDLSHETWFLGGAAQSALRPTIALAMNEEIPLDPSVPAEYQRRRISDRDVNEACRTLQSQVELFEEDFVELDDRAEATRYAELLASQRSGSRKRARGLFVAELKMGDTYITSGQAGAVGPNARVEIGQMQQAWQQGDPIDVVRLAEELALLRGALRDQASTPEEDGVVGAVAGAEMAARAGDGPGALERLRSAGQWALDAAVKIGAPVATEALRRALGLG